jgi:hypothetical protein
MHSPRHLIGLAVCVALAAGPLRADDPYTPAPNPPPYPGPNVAAPYPPPGMPYPPPAAQPMPLPQSPYDTPQARYQRGLYLMRQQQLQEMQAVRQVQYQQQQEQLRFAQFQQQQLGHPVPGCPAPAAPAAPGALPPQAPSPKAPGAPAIPSAPSGQPQTPGAAQAPSAPQDAGTQSPMDASDFGTSLDASGDTGAMANGATSTAFNQAPPSGTADAASYAPQMIGDSLSQSIVRPYVLNLTLLSGGTTVGTINEQVRFQQPVISRGAYKIADDESPRPVDRVYLSYNYFNSLRFQADTATSAVNLTPASVQFLRFGPGPVPFPIGFADTQFSRIDLHRYTFGFEKTILDGSGSIGIRVPILQPVQSITSTANGQRIQTFSNPGFTTVGVVNTADNNIDHTDVGDITLIFKYLLYCSRVTGNVVSTGLAVTLPSGPNIRDAADNEIHPWLFQPYLGYLFTLSDRLYLQGFVAVVAPGDSRDNVRLFNDIGLGYLLYRAPCGGLVRSITPTLEFHESDPLTHRNNTGTILESDVFSLTGGVHIGLGDRSVFTFGVNAPLSGPHPYDLEAIGQLNYLF